MSRFGKLLRKQREEAGKTMGQLARHLGVSVPFLSGVERGRKPPLTNDRIRCAAEFLGINADDLLRAAGESRGAFELAVTDQTSPTAIEVAAALTRRWPPPDEKLEKIREILETGVHRPEESECGA